MTNKIKEVPALFLSKKSNEVPKLKIGSLRELATKLRSRARQIEDLEASQKKEEYMLLSVVKSERTLAEKNNEFYKCCVVETDTEQPVRVQFSNKYSKINIENEEVLKECLGKLYPELFAKKEVVKLRETTNLNSLRQLLGERFELFFEIEEYLVPCDMEHRAKLRQSLNDKTNDVVDQLREQVSQNPSVSYK